MLGAGFATTCPNNNCTGLRFGSNGKLDQWVSGGGVTAKPCFTLDDGTVVCGDQTPETTTAGHWETIATITETAVPASGNSSWWTTTVTGNFLANFVRGSFWKTAFKPGTCGGVFLSAAQAPLQATMNAAQNMQKYFGPAIQSVNVLAVSGASLEGEVTGGAAVIANIGAGLAPITGAAASALPKVPQVALGAADVILAISVGKEAYAAWTGSCHE